ncbi:TPA: hypothetical protein PXR60_002588 [Yersinia enterocolitica]|nr:hypothetical protein [Yersinia enterocolitica]HDL7831948.1 hypothetical protein [Yersinia enterocolitica]HDL7872612.1 hypothetical protein [Yersinia enterocolitica]HDL7885455.1 hypothetical protein [Yersinia enterocolitica]HDL7893921.1 hypothetical protein [Yersinia enterocolitica]
MRKTIAASLFLMAFSVSAKFIHPMDFDGSEAQKNEVIEYIKGTVKSDYCNGTLDMCQDTMLRMMEDENLNAFKLASKATNRKIMDRVIKDYCNSGLNMCNYVMINMMYDENLKASNKSLTW